jgi:hypothetical protein
MRRILQALPLIEEPNELIVGGPDGKPTILSGGSIGDALTIDGDGNIAWAVGGGGGGGYTFSDSGSIDVTIVGPVVSAAAKFGTTAGLVAEGDHTHGQLHDPLVANDTGSIAHVQVGQTFESHAQFGTIAGTVAEGDHNHNSVYSILSHDHNGVYSLLGHNHAGVYQPVGSYQTTHANLTTLTGMTFGALGLDLLDDATAANGRTTLGLSAMATMDPASVAITGGSIAGITDLPVADGGTGASNAATARTNLGLVIGTDVAAFSHNHPSFSAAKVVVVEEFDVGVATALKINNETGPSTGMAASSLSNDLPGVWTLSTNGTNGTFRSARYGWADPGLISGPFLVQGEWEFESIVYANSVTCEFFVGLTNKTGAASVLDLVTGTAYALGLVAYNGGATYGGLTTTWKFARGSTPSASTYTETNIDVDANATRLLMTHDGAGNVAVSVKTAAGATYATTAAIPVTAADDRWNIIVGIQTRSAAVKQIYLDYIRLEAETTRGGSI